MGLSAVVYRNKKRLKLGTDEEFAKLDAGTGAVYFENRELSRKYSSQLRAVECRLGNIAEINALREEVAQLVPAESVVLEKVLHSGTHSGDTIPAALVSQLSAELDSINNADESSPELRRFVGALEELIRAAKDEGNPIVFA